MRVLPREGAATRHHILKAKNIQLSRISSGNILKIGAKPVYSVSCLISLSLSLFFSGLFGLLICVCGPRTELE